MHQRTYKILFLALVLSASSWFSACVDDDTSPEGPSFIDEPSIECARDLDCTATEVCDQGLCVARTCRRDDDCAFAQECLQGECVAIDNYCANNGDCPEGSLCDRETLRCITEDEPDITEDEPDITVDMPDINEDEPDITVDEPDITVDEPDITEDMPDITVDMPDINEDMPDITEDEPDITVDMPDIDEDMPDITVDMPDINEDMPDIDEDMPDITVDMPDITVDMPDIGDEDAFEPPPTPPVGTYRYERAEIGGLMALQKIEFHPEGAYAIVLEEKNRVHLVQWEDNARRTIDLTPPAGDLHWSDLLFTAAGDLAYLVGWIDNNGSLEGVVYRFDHALYMQGESDLIWRIEALDQEFSIRALETDGAGGFVALSRQETSPYQARLRGFDPAEEAYGDFVATTESSARCDDVSLVKNAQGGPGYFVACGKESGADTHYFTWNNGAPQWTADPGRSNLGNTSSTASHPTRDYALVVNNSGSGAIYRMEGGSLNDRNEEPEPRFGTRRPVTVKFQQEGQRALVVGKTLRASGVVYGTVLEYRHDLYACGVECNWTDVSIADIDQPPFNAISNAEIKDLAFRPECDGGWMVLGRDNRFREDLGQIVAFQIENGRPCR